MLRKICIFGVLTYAFAQHIELCCSFTENLQKDVAILSSMFDSVGLKIIMGCSKKPTNMCQCFSSGWGCNDIVLRKLDTGNTINVKNGKPAHIFDQVMRDLVPARKPEDKDSTHVYFCNDDRLGTPYLWSVVQNSSWSSRKWCFSSENSYEIRINSNLSLGVAGFDKSIKQLIASLPKLDLDTAKTSEFTKDDDLQVIITATSELAFSHMSERVTALLGKPRITYRPYQKTESFKLRKEELIMEFPYFKCKAFNYLHCLALLRSYHESQTETLYHLSSDLLDLFMTTTPTPAVLVVYNPTHFEQTQELCVHIDSSLGQSTLTDYTVAMMPESSTWNAGIYYMLYPNTLKECEIEMVQCLTQKFRIYLPPPSTEAGVVRTVFGEQHLDLEDEHKGNLNNRWFFDPPKDILKLEDIKKSLQNYRYEPVLNSDSTSIKLLDKDGYRKAVADKTGHFILFVFRSDVSSLYTIKQLLQTNITGVMVLECFDWNLICAELDITVYPTVYFVRDGRKLHYNGPLETSSMNTFRELTLHRVVTVSHRIQIDLLLKDGENKAAVLISSGKSRELEDTFHLACDELYGFVRCYILRPKTAKEEEVVIVHVPRDPVMINKRYTVTHDMGLGEMLRVLKKLSTPSVISETELLLVYKELTQLVLFDNILDDELAGVVNFFPFVQFVQISSPDFKHTLLNQLIGYDYQGSILFISKDKNCGYTLPEEATLATWIQAAIDGKMRPDFHLKDLKSSTYQYQDIYYLNQFNLFKDNVRSMRGRVDEMRQRNSGFSSHQEL